MTFGGASLRITCKAVGKFGSDIYVVLQERILLGFDIEWSSTVGPTSNKLGGECRDLLSLKRDRLWLVGWFNFNPMFSKIRLVSRVVDAKGVGQLQTIVPYFTR